MKALWAPWRMDYIQKAEKKENCPFCIEKEVTLPDEERLILYVDDLTVILMNKFPYNNGHLLVCPRKHKGDLENLSRKELEALQLSIKLALKILRKEMQPDGFNIGLNLGKAAGAGIPGHLHYQIVPRWEGDVNFMTVLAEIRVIPEHIIATYHRLFPLFQEKNIKKGDYHL